MKVYRVTGTVNSEVKILSIEQGSPFARFTFMHKGKAYNALIAGEKAYHFIYEVKLGSKVTLNVTINNRKQLVVKQYVVHEVPYIEETRIKYPHKKIYS
ncbi:MAG: ssDNA-binding protein [Carnobacterium sp.]|uniref:ssDNA-binding protein n=1 Tax=Carnobacterium sp. TaxID=48221 RepID=UPI002FC6097B